MQITENMILTRLAQVAESDLWEFVTIGENGEPQVDLKRAERNGKLHLIKRAKVFHYDGVTKWDIELKDSVDALWKLANLLGMTKPLELTGEAGGPIEVRNVRDELLDRIALIADRNGAERSP